MTSPLLVGFLTSFTLIAAIGAQNAFVLRQGIRRSFVGPVVAVCAVADAVLIVAGVLGIGGLVQAAPWFLDVVRWGGVIFLLGYAALAARRAFRPDALRAAGGGVASVGAAVGAAGALTFLNPHVYLDTVLLVGSVANQHGPDDRWVFAAGAVMASLVWFTALGYGARLLAPVFARPSAWRVLDGGIAVLMVVIAVGLARH
jgi:L-lysine exporter family protein LysE/ArgO